MIGSVLKALEIMELFSSDHPTLSLNEISQLLGYPKTTIYTILNTLESKGYVERGKGGVYSLGTAIITMTQAVRVNVELRDRAAPLLRELGDFCNETVYLTVLDGYHCLYIYAIESSSRLMARTTVGMKLPMYCSAVGKAILAFLPKPKVHEILEHTGMKAITPHTIVSEEKLFKELEKIKKIGLAVDNQEAKMNMFCLGSPIFDEKGNVFASCSISTRDPYILNEKFQEYSSGILYTAQEISRRMGFIPKAETLFWHGMENPLRIKLAN